MDEDDLLISKPEVYLYDIPDGRVTQDGEYRACDWNTSCPIWQGKLSIYMIGPHCHVELEDKEGNIKCQALIEEYPGSILKVVSDSNRFFTLNVQTVEGDFKVMGMGFANREDSMEVSSVLRGYFAQQIRLKRKLESGRMSDVSPPKKSKPNLVESIYAHTKDPNYKYIKDDEFHCHECSKSFNCPKLIMKHWSKIHNAKKPQLCMLCNLPFFYKGERQEHGAKFHAGAVPCDVCKNLFATQSDVVDHLFKVHQRDADGKPMDGRKDSRFKCAHCHEFCYSKLHLVKHFRELHLKNSYANGSPRPQTESTTDPKYPYAVGSSFLCHVCGETFENIPAITSHWKEIHSILIKYCQCSLPFPNKTHMLAHQEKWHTIPCSVCTMKFTTETDLEVHMLDSHLCDLMGKKINSLDECKFKCEDCNERFGYRNQLLNHRKLMHSSNEEGKGTENQMEFNYLSDELPQHLKSTYPKKCELCDDIITSRKDRKQHRLKHKLLMRGTDRPAAAAAIAASETSAVEEVDGGSIADILSDELPAELLFDNSADKVDSAENSVEIKEEVSLD